jgi:hypothetical protein
MSIPITRIAPTALVLAMAGYSGWPYLGASVFAPPTPTPAAAPAKSMLPELTAALRTPSIPTNHSRDPFQDPEALRAAAIGQVSKLLKSWVTRYLTPPVPGAGAARLKNARGAKPAQAADASSGEDPRLGLVLSATFLQGRKRVALINDRTYEPGQALAGLDGAGGPCILKEVRPYEVILAYQGRNLTLGYPDASSPPRPAAATATAPASVTGDSSGLFESLFGGSEGPPIAIPRSRRREPRR